MIDKLNEYAFAKSLKNGDYNTFPFALEKHARAFFDKWSNNKS